MDGAEPNSISASELYAAIGTAEGPLVVDPRRAGIQFYAENGVGPEDACPPEESSVLAPPERLVGFSERLFLRDADVLKQVKVIALGNFAQRPALAETRDPSADCRACAGDEPAKPRFRMRQGTWGDIPEGQPACDLGRHGGLRTWCRTEQQPDRAEPDQ